METGTAIVTAIPSMSTIWPPCNMSLPADYSTVIQAGLLRRAGRWMPCKQGRITGAIQQQQQSLSIVALTDEGNHSGCRRPTQYQSNRCRVGRKLVGGHAKEMPLNVDPQRFIACWAADGSEVRAKHRKRDTQSMRGPPPGASAPALFPRNVSDFSVAAVWASGAPSAREPRKDPPGCLYVLQAIPPSSHRMRHRGWTSQPRGGGAKAGHSESSMKGYELADSALGKLVEGRSAAPSSQPSFCPLSPLYGHYCPVPRAALHLVRQCKPLRRDLTMQVEARVLV